MAGMTKMKRTNLTPAEIEQLLPKAPPKLTLTGHRGGVSCVAFHPCFTLVASASEDASIRLWDFETGQSDKTLKGHTSTVNCISFDTQGTMLASASSDCMIKIWDLSLYSCTKTLNGHEYVATCVEFLPTNDFVLSGSRDETIKLWEVATGFCVRTYKGHSGWVTTISVSADSRLIASGGKDQNIIIWQLENVSPQLVLAGHEQIVEKVMFVNHEIAKKAIFETSLLSQNGEEEQKDIGEKMKSKMDALRTIKSSDAEIKAASYVLSASRDKTIRLWNAGNGTELYVIRGHDNWVRSLALHHSGKSFYSCSDDRTIRVWEVGTGKQIRKIEKAHDKFITSISASSRFLMIATGSVDNNIKIWECK
jgi:platelet-activating factor acetylhydrolase IB subunit alpha